MNHIQIVVFLFTAVAIFATYFW